MPPSPRLNRSRLTRARPIAARPVAWFAAAAVLGAWAVLASPAAAQDTLEQIKSADVVRVGVAGERPYGYIDDQGRVTGEAPEIARRIFQDIDPDIELEGVQVPFGELIPALNAGRFDVIAAGMYVTPARCAEVRFSTPTYKVGEAFVVRAGNPKGLRDFEDVAQSHDARVAIMAGAVEYNYAYDAGVPGDRALLYPNYDAALRALRRGDVDAIAMTALTARTLIQTRGLQDLEATPQFLPEIDGEEMAGYGAFAFRQDDDALYEAFNARLTDFVGSNAHWKTVRPFGFTERMEPNKSTETLCGG